jgi:tetratricopeptide (TPR) repeat protein
MLRLKSIGLKPVTRKGASLFLCTFLLMGSQTVIYAEEGQQASTSGKLTYNAVSNENARVLVLTDHINSAVAVYAQLIIKDSTNVLLSSEYAYALALGGIYDAAMVRLDKIWSRKADNKEVNYFTSQVFALMGYDQLAGEFWKESESSISPAWISSKAPELLQKHKRMVVKPSSPNHDELVAKFKRANRLTAQNFTLQSIGSFEEIVNQYPDDYLPYVGYSIALEKAGLMEKSAQSIKTALQIVGDSPEQKDTKQFLDQRMVSIKNKMNSTGQSSGSTVMQSQTSGEKSPQMIAYAGGMISSSYSSLNARVGTFLSKSAYAAVDLGLTSSGSKTFTNIGLSVYNRERIFVEGFGITGTLGKGITALYAKISVGLSFMNKNRTSSLDIFLDGRLPITKGGVTSVGLSVGQSIYFGKR